MDVRTGRGHVMVAFRVARGNGGHRAPNILCGNRLHSRRRSVSNRGPRLRVFFGSMRALTLVLPSLISAVPGPLAAQGARVVDQGSFTISVGGRTAGRENFTLRVTTRGDQTIYLATSDVTLPDRRIESELRADGSGAAIEYLVRSRSGGAMETWQGVIIKGRLTANITSNRGTAARESVVPIGAMILDDDVIHQHWLLGLRLRAARTPILVPLRGNAQAAVTVSSEGQERLQIGGTDIVATHLRATESSGDTRDVWLDGSGRLLKVAIPSRSLVAVRDDPPGS